MRIKEGANYILMELGPRRETFIEYTVECSLRGFYSLGPVTVRIQDAFGLFHKEKELHVYNDFLVFPKMEDSKRRSSNPVCRRSSPERSTFTARSGFRILFAARVFPRRFVPGHQLVGLRSFGQVDGQRARARCGF